MASFWKHLDALRACVFRIAVTVGAITLFSFLFDIRTVELFGLAVPYPYPDLYTTVSTRVFLQIKADLLPQTVRHPLVTTDLKGLLRVYQSRYPGAMYSGCGGGYLFIVSDEPVPGTLQVTIRLAT